MLIKYFHINILSKFKFNISCLVVGTYRFFKPSSSRRIWGIADGFSKIWLNSIPQKSFCLKYNIYTKFQFNCVLSCALKKNKAKREYGRTFGKSIGRNMSMVEHFGKVGEGIRVRLYYFKR